MRRVCARQRSDPLVTCPSSPGHEIQLAIDAGNQRIQLARGTGHESNFTQSLYRLNCALGVCAAQCLTPNHRNAVGMRRPMRRETVASETMILCANCALGMRRGTVTEKEIARITEY